MITFKDISKLLNSHFKEIHFLLWITFITSKYFLSYFKNFVDIIFELMPKFLQLYFINIHIPKRMINDLYLSNLVLLSVPFLLMLAYALLTMLLPVIFDRTFIFTFINNFLELSATILLPCILLLHVLNIVINNNYHEPFFTLFKIKEFPLQIGQALSFAIGIIVISVNPDKDKPTKEIN